MATDDRYPGARSQVKKGRTYWRIRKNGAEVSLPGQPGDHAFELAYNKAVAGETQVVPIRYVQGLNGAKLPERSYWHAWLLLKESSDWSDFETETKRCHSRHILEFCADPVIEGSALNWGSVIIGKEDDEARLLNAYIDRVHAKFKSKAVHIRTVVRKLAEIAIAQQWISTSHNPVLSVKIKRRKNTPQKAWPVEVRKQFEAKWPLGSVARTAYALALYLGNRRGDVCNVRWSDIKLRDIPMPDGTSQWVEVFEFEQRKNSKKNGGGTEMLLAIPAALAEALAAAPRKGEFILSGHKGKRRYTSTLTGQMAKWTEKAGLDAGYTLHGLRRTYATLLANNGATTVQVQHAMGHRFLSTTQIYLNEADRDYSMVTAGAIFDKVQERENNMPKRGKSTQLRLVR